MNLLHTVYHPRGDGPYPTIVAMHGRGANSLDLLGLAPHICGGRFLVICPQASNEVAIGPGVVGYAWYSSAIPGNPDVQALLAARDQLKDFLDEACRELPVDSKRLILLGFSQGGVMAYSLALDQPKRFAGLVAMSTRLSPHLLDQSPAATTAAGLPTLIQHGTHDQTIEVDRGREAAEALTRLDVPVTYLEYPMGHEINSRSLTDLSQWLEDKVL
ncbi:MAG: hypothetical protein GTO40_31015 [Deltaproteobacteria bacterium]|nr:hypothetical protein [Deltaproteobacteria bacterium]